MWTASEHQSALREAEAGIVRHWAGEARSSLWHLSRDLFARDGVVTHEVTEMIEALRASHAGREAGTVVGEEVRSQCARSLAALPLAWTDIRVLLTLLNASIQQALAERGADVEALALNSGYLAAIGGEAADLRVQTLEMELSSRREEEVVTQHLAGRFLANASHELRTPLTAVLGFAELLKDESYGPLSEEQATAVGHIENSAQNLLEIVNNLLDLLHIRAGKLTLRYRLLDVNVVLTDLYQILLPLAQRKHVQFNLVLADELGQMEADENIVRHIVYRLLSSALRATPGGGQVELRAWRDAQAIHIEAQDTALHLPPDAIANMLEPFPRLEDAPSRGYEGWEVGLPLVRRYVDLHNGMLDLHSLPTQGTVFHVSLPLKHRL
jgi:signal transduction histidine kinase